MKLYGMLFLLAVSGYAHAFDHSPLARVLSEYVDERGNVDYLSLHKNREVLDGYVALLANSGPESTPELFQTREEKLAFYINAYNALVINGVLDRGPEKTSVWRGLISGYTFFVRMRVIVDGQRTNLKLLEDDLIRAGFRDPRIHAAINCASISCPRLRKEVFVADHLDAQLDAAMREFVNDPRNVRVTTTGVSLSAIFDWFEDDFLEFPEDAQAGFTIVDYVNRYRDNPIPRGLKVSYLKYDKGLNTQ